MSVYRFQSLKFCLALAVLSCLADLSIAAETFTVWLTDGRHVTGTVDAKTDLHYLWLRREESSIELVSGFRWDQVLEGQVGNQRLGPHDIRRWTEERMDPAGQLKGQHQLAKWKGEDLDDRTQTTSPSSSAVTVEPVATLVIKAYLAQWDRDAQSDGLRVFVTPLDKLGRIVPIDGKIEFTLVNEIEKLNGGQSGSLRPEFHQLSRVTHVVRRDHFASGPAVYQVPFSKQHPDFDANIATQALLYARLSVPGRGVYEASDAQVALRESSHFRDHLEYFTPQRYLPLESGGSANR